MAVDFCRERHKSLPENERSELSIAKLRWKMLAKVKLFCFISFLFLLESMYCLEKVVGKKKKKS